MNRLLLIFLLSAKSFTGFCQEENIPRSLRTFKGDYPKSPMDTVISRPFDQIFDECLKIMEAEGIPRTRANRETGDISSGQMTFERLYSFERKGTVSPKALIVVEKSPGYLPSEIAATWNIKLTYMGQGQTRIIVSLVNTGTRFYNRRNGFTKEIKIRSTGLFEKKLINALN